MDHSRTFLVPFHPTNLLVSGIFGVLIAFFVAGGLLGLYGAVFVQIWVFKYCYVAIERLANGAQEPPVMDADMLSPLETRPWIQLAWLVAGTWLAIRVGGNAGLAIAVLMLALLPATVAILGVGEPWWRVFDPMTLFRVVRDLGVYYLGLMFALVVCVCIAWFAYQKLWGFIGTTVGLWCEIAFFNLVGIVVFLRRQQLGFEPNQSPERTSAREEMERLKLRARMIDDVFQLVRIGKHVDATAPLAAWLRDTEADHVSKDAYYVAEQALRWEAPLALNPLGSTLIRHLMRYGRPDAALAVFELLRGKAPAFTMDSAQDLKALADFAESQGHDELAQSMRLETPVIHPSK
jgi:hypothetical protein